MTARPSVDDILAAHHRWYHVIDLAPGVATPGWLDLRHLEDLPRLPADLAGRRALDVGTFDGFWAFAMERRGAAVVAIDIDEIPPPDTPALHRARLAEEAAGIEPGTGFRLLREFFGSAVERVACDVRDLTAERIGGPVDVAFVGSLLLHLRDPLSALERVRAVLAPGGLLVVLEPVDERLTRRHPREPVARFMALEGGWTFWYANERCLEHWLRVSGFTRLERQGDAPVVDAHGGRQRLLALHARP